MKSKEQDWHSFCHKIAEETGPPLEEFTATPFASAEKQRGDYISELKKQFELDEFQKRLNLGLQCLLEELPKQMEERRKLITQLLSSYLEILGQKEVYFNGQQQFSEIMNCPSEAWEAINAISAEWIHQEEWAKVVALNSLLVLLRHQEPSHWFQLALSFYQLDQIDEAKNGIEMALALSSAQPEFHILHAACLAGLGLQSEATNALQAAQNAISRYKLQPSQEWLQWMSSLAG